MLICNIMGEICMLAVQQKINVMGFSCCIVLNKKK